MSAWEFGVELGSGSFYDSRNKTFEHFIVWVKTKSTVGGIRLFSVNSITNLCGILSLLPSL